MSLIAAIIDRFFAKDLWVEITPEVFTFCLETNQLSLRTIIWIQKSRRAVLAVGEELSRDEIQKEGMSNDVQRVDLFATTDSLIAHTQYLEAFFRFGFIKVHNRAFFIRPRVHFTGISSLRPLMMGGREKDLLERMARSAGASAVIFA